MNLIGLNKFNDLRVSLVANSDYVAQAMLAEFEPKSNTDKRKCFAQSKVAGGVFVVTSDTEERFKGNILEVVAGIGDNDFMLTLHEPHPIFNTPGELVKAREELIEAIERMYGAAPGRVMVPDAARKRQLKLQELGTQQLLDQLKGILENTLRQANAR